MLQSHHSMQSAGRNVSNVWSSHISYTQGSIVNGGANLYLLFIHSQTVGYDKSYFLDSSNFLVLLDI